MRLTTQIKKLAQGAYRELDDQGFPSVRVKLTKIIAIAELLDARTGTVDPSRKKRGNKK